MIEPKDIISSQIFLTDEELNKVNKISQMTHNTWQGNRTLESKIADTIIGKMCEKAILEYISQKGLYLIDYDDYRADQFKNHAPVDFIICKDISSAEKIINLISEKSVSSNSFKFTDKERDFLGRERALLCEIKSTRVTAKHKINNIVDLNEIVTDSPPYRARLLASSLLRE